MKWLFYVLAVILLELAGYIKASGHIFIGILIGSFGAFCIILSWEWQKKL